MPGLSAWSRSLVAASHVRCHHSSTLGASSRAGTGAMPDQASSLSYQVVVNTWENGSAIMIPCRVAIPAYRPEDPPVSIYTRQPRPSSLRHCNCTDMLWCRDH